MNKTRKSELLAMFVAHQVTNYDAPEIGQAIRQGFVRHRKAIQEAGEFSDATLNQFQRNLNENRVDPANGRDRLICYLLVQMVIEEYVKHFFPPLRESVEETCESLGIPIQDGLECLRDLAVGAIDRGLRFRPENTPPKPPQRDVE